MNHESDIVGDDHTLGEAWYLELAAAYVRGRLGACAGERPDATVQRGRAAELRLHRFKRNAELPRVRRVLGILQGLAPEHVLDVGSGRGTALWPMLDELPWARITALEHDVSRASELGCVRRGGVQRLSVVHGDVARLSFAQQSFDVATALEVLEHVDDPAAAAAELVRVTRGFIVATVPSQPDDNPEHLRLFAAQDLERLFLDAGARRVTLTSVRGHHAAVVRL